MVSALGYNSHYSKNKVPHEYRVYFLKKLCASRQWWRETQKYGIKQVAVIRVKLTEGYKDRIVTHITLLACHIFLPHKQPTKPLLQCRPSEKRKTTRSFKEPTAPNILQLDKAIKVARVFETSFQHLTEPEK